MKNRAFAKKQSGFFLTELGVALVLFSVFSGIWLYQRITAQQEELRLSSAKQIGETAKIVDDALKTYTTKYFTLIQRGLPITAGGYTVPASRVSSPSMADLVAVANMRPQAASAINYFGQSIGFSASIQVDTSDGCSIPACNLIAIVSSTAPISLVNDSTKPDIQMATIAANTASAANAGVALPESPAVFSGVGGVTIAGNASGQAGRIAIRNGYDSSGMSEFLRRDGSLPMTGDLRMKDDAGVSHSINEAKSVGAETVTTTGRLTTGEFIKLGGTAVEGQACGAENGLVAKDTAGLILSCQSGSWKKAQGTGTFGGSYMTQANGAPHHGYTTFCSRVNPVTNACSCPEGTSPHMSSNGMGWAYSQWDRVWTGYDCLS